MLFKFLGKPLAPVGVFCIALCWAMASFSANNEVKSDKSMAFTVNPIQTLFLTGSVKYHVKIADSVSLNFPVQFTFSPAEFESSYFTSFSTSYWWLEAGVGARFYLRGKAFESGIYVEPEIKVGYSDFKGSVADYRGGTNILSISPGFIGGYAWVFDSGLMVNLGVGTSYNIKVATLSGEKERNLGRFRYPWLILDASIGYAW